MGNFAIRLGAANVASIDINPGLVGEARERLAGWILPTPTA
ncbi:MAG: hypothetical protein ACRDTG_10160 [Pseudonocardiaceae bacterium]